MVRMQVADFLPACDTEAQGAILLGALSQALDRHQAVEVSFTNVMSVTTSFVNASFVELLSRFSFETIKQRIKVMGSSGQISEMIKTRMTREAARISDAV